MIAEHAHDLDTLEGIQPEQPSHALAATRNLVIGGSGAKSLKPGKIKPNAVIADDDFDIIRGFRVGDGDSDFAFLLILVAKSILDSMKRIADRLENGL